MDADDCTRSELTCTRTGWTRSGDPARLAFIKRTFALCSPAANVPAAEVNRTHTLIDSPAASVPEAGDASTHALSALVFQSSDPVPLLRNCTATLLGVNGPPRPPVKRLLEAAVNSRTPAWAV